MRKVIINLAGILILSGLGPAGGVSFAAEFEVLDRFSVDGYAVLRGSADIPGGSFSVGVSTLVVTNGKVGIGTTGPGYKLDIQTNTDNDGIEITNDNGATEKALRLTYDFTNNYAKIEAIQAGTGYKSILLNPSGGDNYGWVGIGTTNPQGKLDVYGKMVVKSDGNVGIGTGSPGAALDIWSNTGLRVGGSAGQGNVYNWNVVPRVIQSGEIGYDIGTNDATYGARNLMTFLPSGNVGIGTTAPRGKLDVGGTIFITDGNQLQIGVSGTSGLQLIGQTGVQALIGSMGSEPFVIRTASTERVRIDTSGNVGIGTTNPGAKLNVVGGSGIAIGAALSGDNAYTPAAAGLVLSGANQAGVTTYTSPGNSTTIGSLSNYADSSDGFKRYLDIVALGSTGGATSNIRFLTGSGTASERMRIDGAGNVGIGTTNPDGRTEISYANKGLVLQSTGGGNPAKTFFLQGASGYFAAATMLDVDFTGSWSAAIVDINLSTTNGGLYTFKKTYYRSASSSPIIASTSNHSGTVSEVIAETINELNLKLKTNAGVAEVYWQGSVTFFRPVTVNTAN